MMCPRCRIAMKNGVFEDAERIEHTDARCADRLSRRMDRVSALLESIKTRCVWDQREHAEVFVKVLHLLAEGRGVPE